MSTVTSVQSPLYGASLPQAVTRYWRKYAVFSGRASRSEYWWWVLSAVVIGTVLSVLINVNRPSGESFALSSSNEALSLIAIGWWLITFIPNWSLTVRRLHDANLRGWWVLLLLIPGIGALVLLILLLLPPKPEGQRFDRAS